VDNTQASTSPAPSPAEPPRAPRPKLRQQRSKRLKLMVLGIATSFVVVGLALPGNPPAPKVAQTTPLQLLNQPTAAPATAQPLQAAPVPQASVSTTITAVSPAPVRKPPTKTVAPKPQPIHPAEPAKASGTVAAAAAPAEAAPARSAALAPAAATVGPPPVTITGCLEMSVDETEFRLTDTEGVEAPKARSWRTGFLKKHSSSIALVELPDAHALQPQVGKRVAATGVLAGGSLKLSALRVVTASCS
jgi:hypothetical protein